MSQPGDGTAQALEIALTKLEHPLLQVAARAVTCGSLQGWITDPPADSLLPNIGYVRSNFNLRTVPLHARLLTAHANSVKGGSREIETRFKTVANHVCGQILPDGSTFPKRVQYARQCPLGCCDKGRTAGVEALRNRVLAHLSAWRTELCKPDELPLHDVVLACEVDGGILNLQ